MNNQKLNKTILIINVFALFYFCFLVLASIMNWDAQAIQVIGEIITIPLILIVFLSLPYCIFHLIKKTGLKFTMPIFFVVLLSIAIVVFATLNRL